MMDNRPVKVSVIVLTYNHEKYIRQALDSILMQKVDFRYEILVGDDASTDGTAEILREYQHKYGDIFRLFLHPRNVGATRNSYELLTSAKGEYLATCEGDDYWMDTGKLEVQVNFLEKNPEYSGTAHRFLIVDEQGTPRKKQTVTWIKFKERFTIRDFEGIYLPGQPSTFVRKNIFRDSSKDFSNIYKFHPMIADRTLLLIFLSVGDFYTFDLKMSCYRQGGSVHTSLTEKLYRENAGRVAMDYELNLKLEQYASQLFARRVVFIKRRNDLFAGAVFAFLRSRNSDSAKLVITMLKESSYPFSMLLSTPYYTAKKIVLKLKELS